MSRSPTSDFSRPGALGRGAPGARLVKSGRHASRSTEEMAAEAEMMTRLYEGAVEARSEARGLRTLPDSWREPPAPTTGRTAPSAVGG